MPENYDNTEIIIAPVATARPQAVIEEERLNAFTPVPLPGAPGRATPSPTPEAVDFMVDEEAMGDLAQYFVEATPAPTPTRAPEETPDPGMEMTDEDIFPDDL